MNKNLKILAGIIIIILIIWGISSMNEKDSGNLNSENETIKIGAIMGFTGIASQWAEHHKNAMELAVDEINNSGGVLGKEIEVFFEDSRSESKGAVSSFNKLTFSHPDVDFVFGELWNFLAGPIIPIANEKKITTISPSIINSSLGDINLDKYFFTAGHRVESYENPLNMFFEKNKDLKKITILNLNDSWGTPVGDKVEEISNKNNVEVVLRDQVSIELFDYRSNVLKIIAEEPDVVFVASYGFLESQVVEIIKEKNPEIKIMTSNGIFFEELSKKIQPFHEGVFFLDWKNDAEFEEKYLEEYGMYPMFESQNSYETVNIIKKAIEISKGDPDKYLESLKKVKYQTKNKSYDFSKGNLDSNRSEASLFKVENGEIILVE